MKLALVITEENTQMEKKLHGKMDLVHWDVYFITIYLIINKFLKMTNFNEENIYSNFHLSYFDKIINNKRHEIINLINDFSQ